MTRGLHFLFASLLLLAPAAAFAKNGNGKDDKNPHKNSSDDGPNGCPVVGIPAAGTYYTANKRKCFANQKKAKQKGYVNAADGSVIIASSFTLSGSEEVPPVTTSATGTCIAALLADKTTLRVMCTHNVSGVTMAHVHKGAIGSDGDVICTLGNGSSPILTDCTLTSAQVTDLEDGLLYVNVHSGTNSGGEIRGQID